MWIEPQQPARPTIVMLHEGLGSIALWKDFPAQLAARTGCGVLVYSRYGHGNSDKLMEKRPGAFHASRRRSSVAGVARQAWHRASRFLLGHSDGGSISLIFAGQVSRGGERTDPGGAARFRGRPQHRQHRAGEDDVRDDRFSAAARDVTTRMSTRRSGDGTISGSIRRFARGTSKNICRRSPVRCCASRVSRMSTVR